MRHFGTIAIWVVVLGFSLISVSNTHAATDGVLGPSSTGSAEVTFTIPELVKVSGISDFALGVYNGIGDVTKESDLCVFHNGGGDYRVTITDTNTLTANIFAVENSDDSLAIPMSVGWNDEIGVSGTQVVDDGLPLVARSGANTQTQDCSSGGLSANMQVTLAELDVKAALPGMYDSTVIILVETD